MLKDNRTVTRRSRQDWDTEWRRGLENWNRERERKQCGIEMQLGKDLVVWCHGMAMTGPFGAHPPDTYTFISSCTTAPIASSISLIHWWEICMLMQFWHNCCAMKIGAFGCFCLGAWEWLWARLYQPANIPAALQSPSWITSGAVISNIWIYDVWDFEITKWQHRQSRDNLSKWNHSGWGSIRGALVYWQLLISLGSNIVNHKQYSLRCFGTSQVSANMLKSKICILTDFIYFSSQKTYQQYCILWD